MQHFSKSAAGAAGAEIVPAEFLDQFLVSVDEAQAALDPGFGWEPLPTLTGALEKRGLLGFDVCLPYDLLFRLSREDASRPPKDQVRVDQWSQSRYAGQKFPAQFLELRSFAAILDAQ